MIRSQNFIHLESRLIKQVGTTVVEYNMIEQNDHVLVCLSGGKDSYTMLSILLALQKRAPIRFRITALNVDQKQPGFPEHVLPEFLTELGVPFKIIEQDTYSIVKDKIPEGKTTCSLCSRLRRGIIYRAASELGATKIALGHHREDIIETLFLNMFFGGILKAMPPKLLSDDGKHVVIRPMANCQERELASYARHMQFPIIPCDLCGSQPNLQRQKVKEMLATWEKENPGRVQSIARALSNVVPTHLADQRLFDFAGLGATHGEATQSMHLLSGLLNALSEAAPAEKTLDTAVDSSRPVQFFARRALDIES